MLKLHKGIAIMIFCFLVAGLLGGCGPTKSSDDGAVPILALPGNGETAIADAISFYPSGSHFIESIINERGKVPVTDDRRRLFNLFARDFHFIYLPEMDYYESFFDADAYAESFGYNNFGYAVFYILSYLNCPEKVNDQTMEEAIQTMFVAKDGYEPMKHQAFQRMANYENGFYSCWPEGGLDHERIFYLLTGLDVKEKENKEIYITVYGKNYYFTDPIYTPGDKETWLANKSEELGLSPLETAEKLIASGEIEALKEDEEFKTVLYVNLEENPDGYHPRFVSQRGLVDGYDILYDFDLVYKYKNTSNDDMEMVEALISQLQYGKKLPIKLIDYSDSASLRVDFSMGLTEGQNYHADPTQRMADAIMLFALQDNLEAVLFNLTQGNYSYGGVSITREQAEEVFGENIAPLGETKELFLSKMPAKIGRLRWERDVMTMITYEHIMP